MCLCFCAGADVCFVDDAGIWTNQKRTTRKKREKSEAIKSFACVSFGILSQIFKCRSMLCQCDATNISVTRVTICGISHRTFGYYAKWQSNFFPLYRTSSWIPADLCLCSMYSAYAIFPIEKMACSKTEREKIPDQEWHMNVNVEAVVRQSWLSEIVLCINILRRLIIINGCAFVFGNFCKNSHRTEVTKMIVEHRLYVAVLSVCKTEMNLTAHRVRCRFQQHSIHWQCISSTFSGIEIFRSAFCSWSNHFIYPITPMQ